MGGRTGEGGAGERRSGFEGRRADLDFCSVVGLDWIFGSLLFFSDVVALSAAVSG
jgi:hypothetical protein